MRRFAIIIFFVLTGNILHVNAQKVKSNNPLIGTWKFVADQQVDESGKVVQEDKDVDGLLIYTNEGLMSVQFYWRGKRQPMMNDSIMNRDGISYGLGLGKNTWTTDDAKMLIDTYDAYFGKYDVDVKNSTVTHVIFANLRPEKSGTTYKRTYKVEGDNLYLRSTNPEMKWQTWLVRIKAQ
jgi:hypothetical protein